MLQAECAPTDFSWMHRRPWLSGVLPVTLAATTSAAGAVRVSTDFVVPSSSVRDMGNLPGCWCHHEHSCQPDSIQVLQILPPATIYSTLCANHCIPSFRLFVAALATVVTPLRQCDIGWTTSLYYIYIYIVGYRRWCIDPRCLPRFDHITPRRPASLASGFGMRNVQSGDSDLLMPPGYGIKHQYDGLLRVSDVADRLQNWSPRGLVFPPSAAELSKSLLHVFGTVYPLMSLQLLI